MLPVTVVLCLFEIVVAAVAAELVRVAVDAWRVVDVVDLLPFRWFEQNHYY